MSSRARSIDEVFQSLGIDRKTPRDPIIMTEFDRWVGENQHVVMLLRLLFDEQ